MTAARHTTTLRIISFMLIVTAFCAPAHGKVIYVDDDATGANDGTSWAHAYVHLQDALADASSAEKPVEIRVAQGTQRPDEGASQTPGDRGASFQLINGVAIRGNYAGLGHEDPNARDVAGFTTSDLAGEWFLGGSDIQGRHTWDGLLLIDSAGAITGGMLASSEGPVYAFIGGDLAIDATGRVTGQVTDSDGLTTRLTMQMDRSKGIVAGEGNTKTDNEDGVFIFIKKSSGFMTSDLAGEWFLGGSDIQGNHTWDGLLLIDSAGAITGGTLASSEGPVYAFMGGDLAIDATGQVTGQVTDSDGVTTRLTMQMDKNKNIIAGEGNVETDDEDGVFIFVRTSSGFTTGDLAGEWFLGGSDIQGNHTWDGLLLINSKGAITGGTLASSEGPVYTFMGGDLAIDATGQVTGQVTDSDGVTTQLTMQMDRGKGIVAGKGNAKIDNEDGVFVFVKRSLRYQTILSGDLLGNDAVVDHPRDLLNEPNRAENSYHVLVGSGTDGTALLDGVAVHGGNADEPDWQRYQHSGGGMFMMAGSPTLSNCTFTGNQATFTGGGIACSAGSPIIKSCTIQDNRAQSGAGISCSAGSRPAISDSVICYNIADSAEDSRGGGLLVDQSSPLVQNCMFVANQAHPVPPDDDVLPGTGGGAICCANDANAVVTASTFIDNHSTDDGGAICSHHSRLQVTNGTFLRNSSEDAGGAIYLQQSQPVDVTNSLFAGNSATYYGGALFYRDFTILAVDKCTLTNNSAGMGGGIRCSINGTVGVISNSILRDNTSPKGQQIAMRHNAILQVAYSNVAGGVDAVRRGSRPVLVWGEGNMDVDPLFADPGYWDPNRTPDDPNDDFWVEGDYHLKSEAGRWDPNSESWVIDDVTSPCIDAGDPNSPVASEPLPNGGIVNMGAYGGTAEASKSP